MTLPTTRAAFIVIALVACNPIDDSTDTDPGTHSDTATDSSTGSDTATDTTTDTATETDADTTGPVIAHTPIADGQARGLAVSIEAMVTDDSAIEAVVLSYRHGTETSWSTHDLELEGNWYAAIDAETVQPESVDYWIKATDEHGNMSCVPKDCSATPYSFTVPGPTGPSLDVCKPAHLDPWTYSSMSITGDTLTIDLSYSGGCKEHAFEACWSGTYLKSSPVQVELDLGHNANDDNCDGWVSDTLTFDLVSLKTDYLRKFPTGKREIVIKLDGKSVSYTF